MDGRGSIPNREVTNLFRHLVLNIPKYQQATNRGRGTASFSPEVYPVPKYIYLKQRRRIRLVWCVSMTTQMPVADLCFTSRRRQYLNGVEQDGW